MPELPEVEYAAASLLREHCKGKVISRANALESGGGPRDGQFDDIVFADLDEDEVASFQDEVTHGSMVDVRRKGKYLWWVLKKGTKESTVLFHLGMTGAFRIQGVDGLVYQRGKAQTGDWPPRCSKFSATFADGTEVAFVNTRRIGRVRWFAGKDAAKEDPVRRLAEDAYLSTMSEERFIELVREHDRKVLKAALLDQQAVMSGIGNWIVDEVCHYARIDPGTRCSSMQDEDLPRLLASIRHVVGKACEVGADSTKFPEEWIFHQRWQKRDSKKKRLTVPDKEGKKHTVKFKTVGGRTTAFAPSLLKRRRKK